MAVTPGSVTVRSGVDLSEHADCSVRMDYTEAAATMHIRSGPDLDAFGAKAFAGGTLAMTGTMAGMPIPMGTLHDEICGLAEADTSGH